MSAPLDADLGDRLAAGELGPVPGSLAEFEAAFTRHVEAGGPGAWDRFYDATLARVAAGWAAPPEGTGTVASFTRIWARAIRLARGGGVLDVGTCFGFLPLAWAARPGAPRLLALDLDRASASLAGRQAARLGRDVTFGCADATELPVRDGGVDTVLLLHVLEHLPPPVAAAALDEAMRTAARRVVVAVPVEAAPDPVYGHLQTFDLTRLAALGAATTWHSSLIAADGAWLILDRPAHLSDR